MSELRIGTRSRHPPWLKGKDIGLFYRDRQRQRLNDKEGKECNPSGNDDKMDDERIKLNSSVDIPPAVLKKLEKCMDEFESADDDERMCYEFSTHFNSILKVDFEEFLEKSKKSIINKEEKITIDKCNESLKTSFCYQQESNEFRKLFEMRQNLPTMKQKHDILKAIEDNQVVLIVGSTGCGKTTQVPQMLLDEYISRGRGAECRVICTQPRRISAISVAERVAYERGESLGLSVGYKIRLEGCSPRTYGSILYCTSGILLQKMQSNPLILGVNIIILDEIHERSVETDLLMALIKKILPHRTDLKVILMSATVSEETFSKYFDNCFTMRIEGTLFPVEVLYLEDILQETGFNRFTNEAAFARNTYGKKLKLEAERTLQYNNMIKPYLSTLEGKYNRRVIETIKCYKDSEGCENLDFLEHLIFYICEKKPAGAILVFLPGYGRISILAKKLQDPSIYRHKILSTDIIVYVLHSQLPTVEQKEVFNPAPYGKRKVILSTILAETSITIDDVVYVINTGKNKLKEYDVLHNLQALEEAWVTKANTQQRKGRAGRVQPGICYNLFTRIREKLMADVPSPEILSTPLESVILQLKLLHITDPFEFLKSLISVPEEKAVSNGLCLLKRIEALDSNENLTPLGVHLARLPTDPQMGKMILMSALFRCLDPITSAAAGLSYKSPFYTRIGKEKETDAVKRNMSNDSKSDHLLIHYAVQGFRDAKNNECTSKYCNDNFLGYFTLTRIEYMKEQFATMLRNSSFLETSDSRAEISNINSTNVSLLRAIIAAGLYPNISFLKKIKKRGRDSAHELTTPEYSRIQFHRSSVNNTENSFDSNYFVYWLMQRTGGIYLYDSTMVFPMALLIFGDGVEQGKTKDNQSYISVANKYFFKCNEISSTFILKLREKLQVLLRKKALYPSPIGINSKDEKLITAIQILLSLDDADGM